MESGHEDSDSDGLDLATNENQAVEQVDAATSENTSTVKSFSFPRSVSENSSILTCEKVIFLGFAMHIDKTFREAFEAHVNTSVRNSCMSQRYRSLIAKLLTVDILPATDTSR